VFSDYSCNGGIMKKKSGFTLIELMIVITIIGILFGVLFCFVLVYKIGWQKGLEPLVNRTEYVLEAKGLVDTMGHYEREGYGTKRFDGTDSEILCEEVGVPIDTSIEDIPIRRIKAFVLENRQDD